MQETVKTEAIEAHKSIIDLQKNPDRVVKTGFDFIDDNIAGGVLGKMIFLGSRPSNGKTYNCSAVINNLLDKEINKTPIYLLRHNLEMSTRDLMLREISKALKRSPKDILSREYYKEEQPIVRRIVKSFDDPNVKSVSEMMWGEEYRQYIEDYIKSVLQKNSEGSVVILTDHIHVYSSKNEIDTLLLMQNKLKLKYKQKIGFINYFQLNRDTEDMWREGKDKKVNPKNMLPNSRHIYETDKLQQFSDLTVAFVIPQVYDMEEYATVKVSWNRGLSEHLVSPNEEYSRLIGRNRIYYNLIKVRMVNSFDDPRLYCSILDEEYEKKLKTKRGDLTDVSAPKFENEIPTFSNSAILKTSWGTSEETPF